MARRDGVEAPSSANASQSQLQSRSNLQNAHSQSRSNLHGAYSRGELGSAQLTSTLHSSRSRGELSSLHDLDKPVADDRFINELGRIVGAPSYAHRTFPRICSLTSRGPKLQVLKSWPDVPHVLESCGFNADFEFGMRYEADRFLGGKVPLGNRLEKGMERMWLRKKLATYPCATIQLCKALRNLKSVDPDVTERFAEVIAEVLKDYDVSVQDVLVESFDGSLCCDVEIQDDTSLFLIIENLMANIRDPDDPTHENTINRDLRTLLQKAGAVDNEIPEAMPQWSFEHIQTEIKLEFPQYELTETQFEQLRLTIMLSWESYREVWKRLAKKEPEAAAALTKQPSLRSFSDALRSMKEGRKLGLNPIDLVHDADTLPLVMDDAEVAQLILKSTFAPNTEWGASKLNDLDVITADAECRNWKSGADDIAPYAIHHDPGITHKKEVLATAQLLQRPYEAHPPVNHVLNIAHIRIVFDSLKNLHEAVQRIIKQFEVLWLSNKFGNPPCVGLLEVSLGVRVIVRAADTRMHALTPPRAHVCEIRLVHADVPCFREGHQHFESIQSLLLRSGVHQNHLARMSRIVLDAFDCTKGRAAIDAVGELQKITTYVKGHSPKFTLSQRRVAEKLVDGVVDQALGAGNEPDLVSVVGTVSPMQRKRALRKLEHDRAAKHGELRELLKKSHRAFGKLAFEDHWSCARTTPLAAKLSENIAQTLISAKEVNKTEALLGVDKTDFPKVVQEKMHRLGIADLHTQVEDHLHRLQNPHARHSLTGSSTFSQSLRGGVIKF